MENFCPTEILPGFLTHQTQRYDANGTLALTDFRLRDWDYLGWKYSVLSSIATAPMNHVLNYLPARDESEFAHFAAEDKKWLRDWLDWTDTHRETLRHVRPIIGPPKLGQVDGTAAITEDRGFVFLFNPNQRAMNAEFKLDASIGLTQGQAFTLTALHPRPGPVGFGRYGDTISLPMEGASALVVELAPARPKLPLLLYPTGNASLNGQTLTVTNVSGPIGQDVALPVVVPAGKSVTSVTVNGHPFPFTRDGDTVTAHAHFAGTPFGQCQPVGTYDPSFTGGAWQGHSPSRPASSPNCAAARPPGPSLTPKMTSRRPGWGRTDCCCTSRSPTPKTTWPLLTVWTASPLSCKKPTQASTRRPRAIRLSAGIWMYPHSPRTRRTRWR